MSDQLSLFTEIGSEYFRIGADALLDAVNLGYKEKDKYKIHYYYQHENLFVLIASNKDKKIICNIVDENGKVPAGFCVCWRIHQHIIQELETKNTKTNENRSKSKRG